MTATSPPTAARQLLVNNFLQEQPLRAARVLDTFSPDVTLGYLTAADPDAAVALLSRMNPDTVGELIEEMEGPLFITLFGRIDTHLAARLLSRVDKERATAQLALLPDRLSAEIKEYMTYRPLTAGFLMDTAVITFGPDNSVQDVLDKLRRRADRRVTTVFITDEYGALVGRVSVQVIAISDPAVLLQRLTQPVTAVNAMASREDALAIVMQENLLQLPVIDINGKLLGVIRNDVLIEATKQELTEDMQAMFGASREEQALSSVGTAVKSRLPWLQVNLVTAFLASFIVGLFEDTIAQITILAVFLPVVAGQSGNTGSQALAVTMRGLALREVRISQWLVVARKEIFVGLINGVAVALTTATIVYFWAGSAGIALVIGISMVLSMMIAGFAGAVIPIALQAVGQDPATSSSIILTTVTDITGFLSFLGLASALASALGIL